MNLKSDSNSFLLRLRRDESSNHASRRYANLPTLREIDAEINRRKNAGTMRQDALKSKIRQKANPLKIPTINELLRM